MYFFPVYISPLKVRSRKGLWFLAVVPIFPCSQFRLYTTNIPFQGVSDLPSCCPQPEGTTEENIAEGIHFHCLRRPDSLRK